MTCIKLVKFFFSFSFFFTWDICGKVHNRQDFHRKDGDDRHTHSKRIAANRDLTNIQKNHPVLVAQLYSIDAPTSNTAPRKSNTHFETVF